MFNLTFKFNGKEISFFIKNKILKSPFKGVRALKRDIKSEREREKRPLINMIIGITFACCFIYAFSFLVGLFTWLPKRFYCKGISVILEHIYRNGRIWQIAK